MVGVDKHVVHAAQVDHEPIAQGATGPVVSTAPYRQRKTRVACCQNCQLHVLRCPAVGDSARHAADWLRPERRCGDISIVTRPRNAAGELSLEPAERPFDQTSHCPVSPSSRSDTLFACVPNGRIDSTTPRKPSAC